MPFLFAITGAFVLLGLLFFFFFSSDRKTEIPEQANLRKRAESTPGTTPVAPDAVEKPETAQSGQTPSESEEAPDEPFSKIIENVIQLKPETDISDLENIDLPPHPYSIYINAFNDIQNAKVAVRELASKKISAYIIPVDIHENVGQSLYGVTENGRWYRVFIGNYPDKKKARKTLTEIVDQAPTFHPEIMPFDYALECGLFTSQEKAQKLYKDLNENEFWPYLQTFQTPDGTSLWRILVGCFFSRQGAETQKNQLEMEDYACRIVKR